MMKLCATTSHFSDLFRNPGIYTEYVYDDIIEGYERGTNMYFVPMSKDKVICINTGKEVEQITNNLGMYYWELTSTFPIHG